MIPRMSLNEDGLGRVAIALGDSSHAAAMRPVIR